MQTKNAPTVIVTNEKTVLPPNVKRGRAYTEYALVQMVEAIGRKQDETTRANLLEVIKLAGTSKQVEVTCKTGTVFTQVQGSKLTNRFTGWTGTRFGSFLPCNVKSIRVLDVCETPANETQEDDNEFYYQ